MTEVKDDPREVLSILNSLGFVGVTAPQLKSFMKGKQNYSTNTLYIYLPITLSYRYIRNI